MSVRNLGRDAFVGKFGGIFEHSAWVAEGAWDAGLDAACETADGLHKALCAVVDKSSDETKLSLLNAHPDLAGKLALAGEMTADSIKEQAGAGLSSLTPGELAEFTRLNDAYKAKFGFPFIIAVRGLDKQGILDAFRARAQNDPATELAAAIAQVKRITSMRLHDMMA